MRLKLTSFNSDINYVVGSKQYYKCINFKIAFFYKKKLFKKFNFPCLVKDCLSLSRIIIGIIHITNTYYYFFHMHALYKNSYVSQRIDYIKASICLNIR